MGSLEHHLRDPQYANWVKNGLALKIANETIKHYVIDELKTFHNSIIEKHSRGSTLEHEIKESHKDRRPTFNISDKSKWMTDSWEVAKCYMPPMRGYGSCTSADADFSTVVNIVINNLHFVPLVGCDLTDDGNIFYQGRVMRNKIMHSNDLRVNVTDFNHNMDLLIEILEAFNPVLIGLNEAVDKIQKLKTGTLTLSLDDVLAVRSEAFHAIKEEVERGKSELGSQVEAGRLTIKKYVEEEKPKIKEDVDRHMERLRDEILSIVTISEEQRLRANFVDGCRHALLEILRHQMEISGPKPSKALTLKEFLGKIYFSQEIGRLSDRHSDLLYPSMGEPESADKWDMFLLCQVPLIETRWNLPNNVILFIKDLKTKRDKLLEKPDSVGLEDLLALCDDYLDDPLKQSTRDIFSRNTTEADTVLVHSVLESWKRNEDDFERQAVSEKYLNENKKLAKDFEFLRNQFEKQQRHIKQLEEQRQETDGRLKRLETPSMAQSTNEGVDMGARPKKLKTRVELKAKNCYKADICKIESNITSEKNNIAMKNGSIKRFNEEMEIDDTKPKQGSIIFEVTCDSITQLIAFWDKCMDGRAVKALSDVRDTYREFTNCKELEFDVILTKKEVERCMNQIVDDLHSRVHVMGYTGKPDQLAIFKKPVVHADDAEEVDKSVERASASGKELKRLHEAGEPKCMSMVVDANTCPQPSTSYQLHGIYDRTQSTREHIMTDTVEAEPINDLDAPPPPVPKRLDSLSSETEQSTVDMMRSNSEEFNINPETSMTIEFLESTESIASETAESVDIAELKLKDYQLELAYNAIQGKNTVVCAATGSGKTFVALHIVKEHLRKARNGSRKVVFMARTSALIKQQADRFKKYLSGYETKLVTGESEDSRNVRIFLEFNDILCMTPQILLNNLQGGAIKSLSEFSLLVLDECHHTVGDEPYNNLMKLYLTEKEKDKRTILPQIVGLTASLTIGKAQTEEDACQSILELFARLDVRTPSVVQVHKENYENYCSQPMEERIAMKFPVTDPCKEVLLEAMSQTEADLEDATLLIPSMADIMTEQCPPNKQSLEYNKWTVEVQKAAISNIHDDSLMRNVITCAVHLNVYNAALEVNSLLGPKDVITFLAQRHETELQSQHKLTEDEKKLLDRLKDVQRKLRQHINVENPNIRTLCDVLADMMNKDLDNSRAMVFVKARATCLALGNYLKKDFAGKDMVAHYLYGKENRGGIDGMTESVQNETLRKFREGDYKILVATSVGVEGIDVPDCNIVMNYNFLGNEITKLQMKGRSRKRDGQTVIMGNAKLMEQDRINAYRILLMQRGLKLFLKMDDKTKERKVLLHQKMVLKEFEMQKGIEIYKRGRKSKDKDFKILCKRCNTFACRTSDVRMISSQYIVIDHAFVDKIEQKPHKRPKMFDGFYKKFKMYCKHCPNDWGIVSENKGLMCYTLKLENFKLKDSHNRQTTVFKKWDDVPVVIPEIESEDLPRLLGLPQQQ